MNFTFQSYNVSPRAKQFFYFYVYLSLKKIWNTRKIILLTLENIIPRLKRSHETVFQDSSFPRYGEQIVGLISLYGGKIVSHPQFDCHPRHLQSRGRQLSACSLLFFFFTWFPLFYLFTRTTHNFCQWFIWTWRVYSFVSPFSRLRSFRKLLFSPSFVNSYATDLLLRVARHGKGSKKKNTKKEKKEKDTREK